MTRIVIPGDPLIDGPTALRPWRDVDADAIVEACRDPDVVRWTSVPEGYGPSDARAFLLFRHDVASAGRERRSRSSPPMISGLCSARCR